MNPADSSPTPRVVCVIQARMGSTRLPGKSLMPLGPRPLLGHVLERARLAESVHQVVLAAPDLPEDRPVAELGEQYGVAVFRGHPTDLVHRYRSAAAAHRADVVVRIPADNPLIHPSEVDRIVRRYLEGGLDFASNIAPFLGNQYPDGLGAEVFSRALLEAEHAEVSDPRHREHVTTYFKENPGRFRLGTVPCPEAFRRPDIVLDVNTPDDYRFIKALFDDLSRPDRLIRIEEIIPWYDAHKSLRKK